MATKCLTDSIAWHAEYNGICQGYERVRYRFLCVEIFLYRFMNIHFHYKAVALSCLKVFVLAYSLLYRLWQ